MNILNYIKTHDIFMMSQVEVENGCIYTHGNFIGSTSEEATPSRIKELEEQDNAILRQMGFSV